MPKRHRRTGLLPVLCVVAGSLVATLSDAAKADPYRKPIQAKRDELSSITFARLVLRLPGADEIKVAGDELRVQFLEALRANGYPALGMESIVFEQDNSNSARFALGGTANELVCAPIVPAPWRRCRLGVHWELMDRSSKNVVYRVSTRHLANAFTPEEMGKQLVWGVFYSLLARPKFVEALKKRPDVLEDRPFYGKAKYKQCQAESMTMPGAAEKVLAATVLVEAGDSLGSGVIVSPDGFVLTAAHVVSEAKSLSVQLRGAEKLPAILVRIDRRDDVALLKIESSSPLTCLAFRNDPMRVGDEVYAIGSPLGKTLSFSLTRGIVSGFREIDGVSLLQTDASVNRGNSGGPLIDSAGRWTAITTWKAVGGGVEGIAFGVPTRTTLDGLALESADATDASLRTPEAAVRAVAAAPIDDADDPVIPLFLPPPPRPPPPPPVPEKPLPPRTASAHRVENVGWIVSAAGAAGILGTFFYYKFSESSLKPDGFDRALTLNDVSWAVAIIGLGVVGTSYIMPRQKEAPPARTNAPPARPAAPATSTRVSWAIDIGPRSVGLQLRY
ncbi:MAG: trypsin-like peptidase domain-containing protein [Deltaproteobacteria bacterium]|nr:trypsin-like peptidase domain-containing protein [Deltaproteobacteria bacterium]